MSSFATFAGPPGRAHACAVAPGRIVSDAIGWVADHKVRLRAGERRLRDRSHRCSRRTPADARPSNHTSPGCVTGAGSGSGAKSGSVSPRRPALNSAVISSSAKPMTLQVLPHLAQISEFEPQQFGIPAGVQRQLVVRQDVGALLGVAPTPRDDHRHLGEAEPLRRQSRVHGRRSGRLARRRSPEPSIPTPDARGYLRDLCIADACGRSGHTGPADQCASARPCQPASSA